MLVREVRRRAPAYLPPRQHALASSLMLSARSERPEVLLSPSLLPQSVSHSGRRQTDCAWRHDISSNSLYQRRSLGTDGWSPPLDCPKTPISLEPFSRGLQGSTDPFGFPAGDRPLDWEINPNLPRPFFLTRPQKAVPLGALREGYTLCPPGEGVYRKTIGRYSTLERLKEGKRRCR